MKKIILSILFIAFVFASIGQNLKGYYVEAYSKLEAKRAFVIDLDTFYATTQLSGIDTILATKEYVKSVDSEKVTGPASSTDNAIARFDGTTGKLIQNSGVTISDAGAIVTPSTIQASSAIFSGDINVNGSDINTTLNDFKININSTNRIYRITRANAFADAVNSVFQQFGSSINDNIILSGANGALLNRFGLTAQKFVFGGSFYNYANLPAPVKDFNVYGTSYFSNTVDVNNTIQATTAKLTNLTDAFLPIHTSDAVGLVNSNVSQSSNILLYNSANAFSTDREIPDVGWVKSGVMAGKTSTTASTALTNTDYTVICQTGVTKLLFPASPSTGKVFVLVNHTGSAISLRNSGDTGDVSYTNYSAATVTTLAANSAIRIQYIGTTWYLIE